MDETVKPLSTEHCAKKKKKAYLHTDINAEPLVIASKVPAIALPKQGL